jgi:arginyl-tRNA synthetase
MNFGELSSSIAHEVARQQQTPPTTVAEKLQQAIDIKGSSLIAAVETVSGYLNFRLNYATAGAKILGAVVRENESYGIVKVESPKRVSVEHTSANPSGPLTMGHARNSILGDALARLQSARGHRVNRRFYVDDVGRQVSILAYGYKLLGKPKPEGKADQWFGRLYTCTNCAVQIQVTKRKLKDPTNETSQSEERMKLQRDLDEWVQIASELENQDPQLFDRVVKAVQSRADPEKDVQELGRDYERKENQAAALVREVSRLCLEGITETLTGMDIMFDKWDWESQVVWDGLVEKALGRVLRLPFTNHDGLSTSLDVNAIVEAYSLRDMFHLSPNYEVPPLTLVRSDGTTLYPTRDIAYSMFKFSDSDRVINVIASEQSLPQLQIRVALFARGERDAAANLLHYSYGLVELPGAKMSKRRGHYVLLDEVVQQAMGKVKETLARRREELSEEESEAVTREIALGAIKFAMLNVNSIKNIMFTWDRVLSLERNSSPFINYAYTRAGSILRKLNNKVPENVNHSLLGDPLEKLIIFKLGQMPGIFTEAADQLKPEDIASYANSLAEKFHEYYEKVDVIHSDEQVKNARAVLVRAVQIVLRNNMELLGIKVSERM